MEKVDYITFMELYIDSKLTWTKHVDYLCKCIARNIGVINKIKHFIPPVVLASLYNTLILTYLSYGILAWGACSLSNLNRLFLLPKRAIRIINFTDFNAHTDPLFSKHKMLKIKHIHFHQLGSLVYQSVAGSSPYSINTLFTRNLGVHSHNTRQIANFHLQLNRHICS